MRTTFKKVKIKNDCYLYPTPVVKEHKYLLKLPCSSCERFIQLLAKNEIASPENETDFWIQIGTHTDGKTPILIFKDIDLF